MVETHPRPRFGDPREPKNRANPGSRLASALDLVAVSHIRATLFLVLCGLVLFLPGFFNIPPIDRDEARFAQATKQMVESGDFVDIRFQDDVRYKKPVGIYWMQAAVVETASALGLPRATWLTFRRTYSSWSHAKGVPGKVIAQLIGHANVDTTLNVYTQVLDGSLRAAADQVGSELFTIVHTPDGADALSR